MIEPAFDWTSVRTGAWVATSAGLAITVLGLLFASRRRRPWRGVLLAAFTLVGLRVVLFENPLIWQIYVQKLDAEQIGWRQASVMHHQRDRFLEPGPPLRYLAVGSSQTDRIYAEYAQEHEDLGVFGLAGMTPLDLYLNRAAIDRVRHRTVLLYVSDFDLARRPPSEAIVTAPAQGLDLLRTWSALRSVPTGTDYQGALVELAVGELLPEYKYRFVLRGALNEAMQKVARRLGRPDPATPRASQEQLVTWLRESFDASALELNLMFLEKYLDHATARGVEVVIAEGRYRSIVSTPSTLELAARARTELHALAARHRGVRFFESAQILDFTDEDFDDLTHVTFESGRRFVHHLLALCEDRPAPTDYSPAADPLQRMVPGWTERTREHDALLRAVPDARLVFVGDSLTGGWMYEGRALWEEFYAPYGAVNLGIAGDRTEHLLWRLQRADLEAVRPRVAVLLIGSNNSVRPAVSAADIVRGVLANVEELRRRWPQAEVLLLGVFPRGAPGDAERVKIDAVNRGLAGLVEDPRVHLLDIGSHFLDAEGRILPGSMPDGLHLSPSGYATWAAAMHPLLETLLARE